MATNVLTSSKGEKIKWTVLLAVLVILWILPKGEIYTPAARNFFMITFAGIYLMAVELIPLFLASLLMPIGYWFFNVAPAGVVFGAWSGQIAWCVLGSMMTAVIMQKTGLGKRMAFKLMMMAKGNFYLVILAFMTAGLITAVFVTTAVARVALFSALLMGLCEAMDWKPNSKYALLFVMALSIGPGNMAGCAWSTGSGMSIIINGQLEALGYGITFTQWALYNVVPNIIMMILQMLVIAIMFKNADGKNAPKYDAKATHAFISEEYKRLGKMGGQEVKAVIFFCIILGLLLTSKYNGLNAGKIFMFMVILAYLPGVRLLDHGDTSKINFAMVFMIAGCLTIGDVAGHLGLGAAAVNSLVPYLPEGKIGISVIVFAICFVGNLCMTPVAMCSVLVDPLVHIAGITGMNPVGLIMIFMNASAALLFPYETGSEMLLYSTGLVSMKNYILSLAVRSFVLLVGLLIVYIPWFTLMGIL